MSRNGIELRFSSPAVERARARMHERDRARLDGATGRVIGNRVDLVVPLDEFHSGPVMVSETLPTDWVSDLVKDNNEIHWTATAPAKIELGLEIESAFVRIQGEAHFSLQHLCVRCGQRDVPFEVPLVVDLRLVERAADKEINADYEQFDDGDDHAGLPLGDAADLEDIDIASYTGNSVDLAVILREQLFLELPPHPNCESPGSVLGEPCLRGVDKLAVEREHELVIDPRWAGLLSLKSTLTDVPAGPAVPAPSVLKAPQKVARPVTTPAPAKAAAAPVTTKKKPAAKKPAATKKPAKKAAAKKAATKKPAAKKAATKKPAKKAATKKPTKKAATKKPTKKAATKKPAKKAAAKKPAATKKAAAKKKATQKKTPARR